jgi:prepilin peptidase dependent protein B
MLGRVMAHRQHGLSLVELMVGLALGLIIIAVAITLVVDRVREHRTMLVESRLLQDLRTSAEIITRDLRRAGYWGHATHAMRGAGAAPNPYATATPVDTSTDVVSFQYSRDESENDTLDSNEQFGFRLRSGVIQMLMGDGSWQALTDNGTMIVTAFEVVPSTRVVVLDGSCEKPCAAGAADCPPVQHVRSFSLKLTARATRDPSTVRSLQSHVRLRNDTIVGRCAA